MSLLALEGEGDDDDDSSVVAVGSLTKSASYCCCSALTFTSIRLVTFVALSFFELGTIASSQSSFFKLNFSCASENENEDITLLVGLYDDGTKENVSCVNRIENVTSCQLFRSRENLASIIPPIRYLLNIARSSNCMLCTFFCQSIRQRYNHFDLTNVFMRCM